MKTVVYGILSLLAVSMAMGTANAAVCTNTNLSACPIEFFVISFPTAPHPNTQIQIAMTVKCNCSGAADMQLLAAGSSQILAMKSFTIQSQSTYSETVYVLTPNKTGPWHLTVVLVVGGNTLNWAITVNVSA
jgi:hypothetical protein